MPKLIDLTGERFGRLVVVRKVDNIKSRSAYLCRCDCGADKAIPAAYLRHGGVKSCGCLRNEASSARGKLRYSDSSRRNMSMYKRWVSVIQRCENPNNPFFKNYGARGIRMCEQWRSDFDLFLADMGDPPTQKHTIERIDNNGPYSPQNCKWALRSTQLRNRRNNITICIGGEKRIAKDWAAMLGVPYQRLTYAYRTKGICAAEAIIMAALGTQN